MSWGRPRSDGLDAVLDQLAAEWQAEAPLGPDPASSAGRKAPPANFGVSGNTLQVHAWDRLRKLLLGFGIKRDTLRNEQAQVIRRKNGKGLIQANAQPDLQAIDPRTGRHINIEVDSSPAEMKKHKATIKGNDPSARSVFFLLDKEGHFKEKHVYDPSTGKFTIFHNTPLLESDVLDRPGVSADAFQGPATSDAGPWADPGLI